MKGKVPYTGVRAMRLDEGAEQGMDDSDGDDSGEDG
jgi:hypothetical protein